MVWEWSHTQEAYEMAQAWLYEQPREWLVEAIVAGECETYDGDNIEQYEQSRIAFYTQTRGNGEYLLYHDLLADRAWEIAESHRTCSNGGFDLYIDRQGWYRIPLS